MQQMKVLICLVIFVNVVVLIGGLTDKVAHASVERALLVAHAELEEQKAINEALHKSGMDGNNKQRFGHRHMHNIFRFMKQSFSSDADHAAVITRATQELTKMFGKSVEELMMFGNLRSIWLTAVSKFCSPRKPVCIPTMYRSADGSCNNVFHPTWGMSGRPQKRYLPPMYADDVSVPRILSVTGKPLPSPREVSNYIHQGGKSELLEPKHSVMVMQWGQLLDHDFADTPMMKGHKGADITCCGVDPETLVSRKACFPIPIPLDDPHFKHKCMNFVRSVPTTYDTCDFGRRTQINQASAYIDASFLYGADAETMQQLRSFTQGFMKMNKFGYFLPETDQPSCIKEKPEDYCMKSGDKRMHIVPGLASTQIMFLREHNRIAGVLGTINPHWKDEQIFQETRKIIMAINQHITYTEYLPTVLGPVHMLQYGLYSTPLGFNTIYSPKVDATMANGFAAAAFRFGHSQIPSDVAQIFKTGKRLGTRVEFLFNRPGPVTAVGMLGSDTVNRWLINDRGARADRVLENGVRNYLFMDKKKASFDLASLNIQRGRDHGIPGYNVWRQWCGLPPAVHFGHGPGGLVDVEPEAAHLLEAVYSHPDDIDLFSGGLSEMKVKGAAMGPTFSCIVAQQLKDMKYGDRFWYENDSPATGFTIYQLNEIKKIRLSSVLCNTMDETLMAVDAFTIPSIKNPRTHCAKLPQIDLMFWKDPLSKML